jgi:D,D-heptose 1,7-bisphosphate phosphatase
MKAIFLDRDGTINIDEKGYINDPKDFNLFENTTIAIKRFNQMGFKTIIVSNQSGIARGLVTLQQLDSVHQKLIDQLKAVNAHIDLILFSPYFKDGIVGPYNIEHNSRKPGKGMFFQALNQYPIMSKESYMIGDKKEDIEFAKNCGLKSILVKTGAGLKTWEKMRIDRNCFPDFVVSDLLSAANLIFYMEKQYNANTKNKE